MKLLKKNSRALKAWEKEAIQAIHHWNIHCSHFSLMEFALCETNTVAFQDIHSWTP